MIEDNNESVMEIDNDNNKFWKNKSGEFHRLDGPAVEFPGVSKSWFVNGKLHRTDGPAIEYADGFKFWYINGKRHRLDGPAVDNTAVGYKEWRVDDIKLNEEEFDSWVKNNGTSWNEELEILFKMSYS